MMAADTRKPKTSSSYLWQSHTRRDQAIFLVLTLVFLAIAGLLHRSMARTRTEWNLVQPTPDLEKTYRSAAINFPRLTLGGFRGLLSTALWIQAEDDKNERRWRELETKYDIIGALQPYFVSVYVYHSWNQAFNLSAQFQEEDTKYKWVLDGLAYLYKGEQYNPGSSQLYYEQGQLYFLKLGGAFERIFYRAHWRDDISRLYQLNQPEREGINDDNSLALGIVRQIVNRPYFNMTELKDPAGKANGAGWGVQITNPELFKYRKDQKQLTEPVEFRWGLSPFYFGYVEFERSMKRTPPQNVGIQVADALPAMSLRLWCRDDSYHIYELMKLCFLDKPDLPEKQPEAFTRVRNEILDCQRNIEMVAPFAVDKFKEHLGRFPNNRFVHTKHIRETETFVDISRAEAKLFESLVKWQNAGRKMTPEIISSLQEAITLYEKAFTTSMIWVDTMYPATEGQDVNPDRLSAQQYPIALRTRARGIEKLLTLTPSEKPDFSFLGDEPVEK